MRSVEVDLIESALYDAVSQPPRDRASLPAALRGSSPAVAAEFQSLLAAHDAAGPGVLAPHTGPAWPEPPELTDRAGQRVGAFVLTGRIGSGGMGVVYRAESLNATPVAIKILAAPAEDTAAHHLFAAERRIHASLRHPGIAALLGWGRTDDGQPYLVMEYVDGRPLAVYRRATCRTLADSLALLGRISLVVHHLHGQSVAHGDLKPANILITGDGTPKLIDFGAATWIGRTNLGPSGLTGPSAIRPVTPAYASPEQLRGLPPSHLSDVYALGMLLHETLTGTRPYDVTGLTSEAALEVVMTHAANPPCRAPLSGTSSHASLAPDLAADLDALVDAALRREPSQRHASAAVLAAGLARCETRAARLEPTQTSAVYR